jgi:DNA-binding GntR family transcriptional regulator
VEHPGTRNAGSGTAGRPAVGSARPAATNAEAPTGPTDPVGPRGLTGPMDPTAPTNPPDGPPPARHRTLPGAPDPHGDAGAPHRASPSPHGEPTAPGQPRPGEWAGPGERTGPAEGRTLPEDHGGQGRPPWPPGENLPGGLPGPRSGPGTRVRRLSVRGQILDALRTALVEGELVPGEVYSAPVLAERFGVSATPVREAMHQLARDGAVEVVPNRGFRVVCRTARELAELAEVRALIEVPVVLRLAVALPAARWADLRPFAEATTVPAGCADRVGYAVSDRAFHRALLGLAGNQQLVRTVDELHLRAQWPRASGPKPRRRAVLLAHATQHTALLDALTARDLTLVESLVREHFTTTDR